MPRRVFITVAEVSGDRIASQLIRALRQIEPDIIIEAYGGPQMAAEGANILYETTTGAAMTLHGARRVFEVRRLLKRADRHYRDTKPDLQICVDSSAMNLHFARVAKRAAIPVMYYVAPQVWASRQGRIKQIRAYVDRLACIFPFEQEYFCSRGVHATFVGHPLFDQLPRDRARGSGPRFPGAPPVVGVVPGSRRSEVTANLPRLIQVMQIVQSAFQNVTFLIPTTPAVDSIVRQTLEPFALNKVIEENGFDAMMRSCDLCLCKSGTSTLHVAAWGVPMIVVYHVSPILWHMLGRWMVKTRKIAMVNILAGQRDLVSEFIPFSDPQAVANCALDLLNHPGKLEAQRAELKELIAPLDKPGASANAARVAIELMEGKH